jgi:hypothetical protein
MDSVVVYLVLFLYHTPFLIRRCLYKECLSIYEDGHFVVLEKNNNINEI